ncbi:protein adenylyltransferase SelO family protein [Novosphingobium sp.]|uniref:protein adenylyltransferase SelO family protein n=1 Tax=Novosphingobium sp. TaxID=1874826 RepID=UPI0035AE04D8
MRAEPQAAPYTPASPITSLSDWLAVPVDPADFPETTLRFRNTRWDSSVGLGELGDADWVRHFGRFEPLPQNLPRPLALKYHGHQFRVYNPELGDGRGFLFAQLRDGAGRLLDLGTKGSGLTPYSRTADGRLTLKGAVREILATEMLEALGVNTSKTFSVIETGEELFRQDEPSPARSAVMVRLSHGHIRIGTFQRLLYHDEREHLAQLVDYCLAQYPGPLPPEDVPGRDEPAVILLHQVVGRLASLAAQWAVAGFVHGVLNTDNMNISGESFDYGPWRWLPKWDASFTAAYFDHARLYAFGRQAEALHWNCGQLAVALRMLAEAPPLIAALERFGPLYQTALARQFVWRLGLKPKGFTADAALVAEAEKAMHEAGGAPHSFFHRHRFGRAAPENAFGALLKSYEAVDQDHEIWAEGDSPALLIDDVEALWSRIADHDDWSALHDKVAQIRRLGSALGVPPITGY